MKVLYAEQPQCGKQLTKIVELSSAELLALRATPIEIISAPGAGFVIIPDLAYCICKNTGQTPYTVSSGGDIEFLLGTDQPFGVAVKTNEAILNQADDNIGSFNMIPIHTSGDFAALSTMENKALKVKNVGGGEYTAGTGTLIISVRYTVVPVTFVTV